MLSVYCIMFKDEFFVPFRSVLRMLNLVIRKGDLTQAFSFDKLAPYKIAILK